MKIIVVFKRLLASGNDQHGRHLFKWGNRWNIFGFNFTKRNALSSVYKISMVLTLILKYSAKQRDMKLYPIFALVPSFRTKFTTNFVKIFLSERRQDMVSFLHVLSGSGSCQKQQDMNL